MGRPQRPVARFSGGLPCLAGGCPRDHRPDALAAPHNDLADLLTLPGYEQVAAHAAVDALVTLARAESWNVRLEDLDPDGALIAAGRIGDGRRSFALEPSLSAPVINLRDPIAGPSTRRSRRLDRSLKRLRAQGHVEFVLRSGASTVDALEEFQRLRDIRLRCLDRDLALPPAEFLDAAVRGLAPFGRCGFMEMLVDGVAVARDLYLLDGAVAMLWLRALDMNWLAHSCGHLLLRAAVERFAADGYGALDMGRGDEPYKFSFGARDRRLLNARLSIDEH
jgi:CelD/BcsL family acetyltransferase involved in cellulose biosynthesis